MFKRMFVMAIFVLLVGCASLPDRDFQNGPIDEPYYLPGVDQRADP